MSGVLASGTLMAAEAGHGRQLVVLGDGAP